MSEEKEANQAEGTQESDGLGPEDLDQLEATGKGEDKAKGTAPSTEGFISSGEVPPELQPRWKQMQAAYTKKTQELAEVRKSAEGVLEKATLFDRVFADPRVTNFVASLAGMPVEEADLPADGSEADDQAAESGALKQLQSKVSMLEQALIDQRVAGEKAEFLKAHPNWEQEVGGKEAMGNFWRANPHLTMEQAYQLAAYNKLQQIRSERVKQKSAAVESPGVPRRSVRKAADVQSLEDALAIAREELGWTGPNP